MPGPLLSVLSVSAMCAWLVNIGSGTLPLCTDSTHPVFLALYLHMPNCLQTFVSASIGVITVAVAGRSKESSASHFWALSRSVGQG